MPTINIYVSNETFANFTMLPPDIQSVARTKAIEAIKEQIKVGDKIGQTNTEETGTG